MPVAHKPLVAAVGQLVGMAAEQGRDFGLNRLHQQRSRAVAQNLGQRISKSPGCESWKTLVSVTAYHSFGEKWRRQAPPRYAALPLHAVTNFRP